MQGDSACYQNTSYLELMWRNTPCVHAQLPQYGYKCCFLHIVCFNYVSHMLKNISYNLHYVQSPKQIAHKSVLQVRNVIIKSIIKSFSIENILPQFFSFLKHHESLFCQCLRFLHFQNSIWSLFSNLKILVSPIP